ncbi:galectin-7-like isoform X2 [Coccinella septempunctata]|uniref:galectin-7-like isoform X2 n=1 Tax=Coccinella septempunctata TaxID=41139 RepID=UPI001D079C5A|nr:galectin-7-like isoform X2 [Coccinella septempunctata]
MAAPIVNPPTPFTTIIPGGFFPGKMIRIRGFAPMHGQRFDINLQTGPGGEIAGEDVALHASVRLTEGYIARNTFQGGCWQEELGDGGMPIQLGQRFEFLLLCEAFDYKIAVNGQHFCSFPPRVPYNRITHLLIEGDVQLEMISWEGSGASAPPMNEPPKYGDAIAPPQYTPQQTYVQQSAPMPPPGAGSTFHAPPRIFVRSYKEQNPIVGCIILLVFIAIFGSIVYYGIKSHNEFKEESERHMREFREKHGFN